LDRRSFLAAAAAAVGGALTPSLGVAAQIGDVRFDDNLHLPGGRLRLLGAGLYYYKRLLKVAAAALYLDDQADACDPLADIAKRLEMQYFWSVTADKLIAGSNALLRRNLSAEQREKLQPQIEAMHALYRDVERGDRSALMYLPGTGTSLLYNGEVLGTVAGADFASAYFAIWFGERPLDLGLKKKLLGIA
jgi:Chalcone isomerase-like